jgi:hypothetical protein
LKNDLIRGGDDAVTLPGMRSLVNFPTVHDSIPPTFPSTGGSRWFSRAGRACRRAARRGPGGVRWRSIGRIPSGNPRFPP